MKIGLVLLHRLLLLMFQWLFGGFVPHPEIKMNTKLHFAQNTEKKLSTIAGHKNLAGLKNGSNTGEFHP